MNVIIIFDVSHKAAEIKKRMALNGYYPKWKATSMDKSEAICYLPGNSLWKPNCTLSQAQTELRNIIDTINVEDPTNRVVLQRCISLATAPWDGIAGIEEPAQSTVIEKVMVEDEKITVDTKTPDDINSIELLNFTGHVLNVINVSSGHPEISRFNKDIPLHYGGVTREDLLQYFLQWDANKKINLTKEKIEKYLDIILDTFSKKHGLLPTREGEDNGKKWKLYFASLSNFS